jgi:pyrroline-5-carboxylate reductase
VLDVRHGVEPRILSSGARRLRSGSYVIGFVGSGNMARALAVGWGEPVLCTDSGSGRAQELAELVGGEAVASNRELAERADLVVLAHKPPQLQAVAEEIGDAAQAVVSLLARTTQAEVRAAYPGTPVFRVEPNTPVEVRRGVLAFAIPDAPVDGDLHAAVRERFARVGAVVDVPEALMRVAGATGGVGPAYFALLAEAWVDAAVRNGMPARTASVLVTETMAGSAELLRARGHDTLAVRRAVASPGGTTARGLAALERGGVRAALLQAMDDVVGA